MARRARGAEVPQRGPAIDWPIDHYTLVESRPGDGGGYTVLREYR
jgi:2'-5' RNA ligase